MPKPVHKGVTAFEKIQLGKHLAVSGFRAEANAQVPDIEPWAIAVVKCKVEDALTGDVVTVDLPDSLDEHVAVTRAWVTEDGHVAVRLLSLKDAAIEKTRVKFKFAITRYES